MELNKLYEVNPDDLDTIFRGIQQEIEQKENDLNTIIPQLQEKYKNYNLQDHDKKLIRRFHIRISQLFEKCKTPNAIDYISSIIDILNCDGQNLNFILNKIQKRSEDLMQSPKEDTNSTYVKKSLPNWQQNIQENQRVFQFYDSDFWKLYDILLLQRQYCLNLITLHQTKQQNYERLYSQSLERNQRFNMQNLQPTIEMNTLIVKAQYLNSLKMNEPIQTIYSNKSIIMFGKKIPKEKAKMNIKYSFSVSPQRASSRDPRPQGCEIKRIFETENLQLYDQNISTKNNMSKKVYRNDNYITIIDTQFQEKTKLKLCQEIYCPYKINKKQTVILPEIKSPYQFDQNDSITKTIQLLEKKKYLTPDKYSAKKSPLSQDLNGTLCQQQQILPQFKINTRDLQTIRSLIGK
ncbi:unnamed protein product (macronuclear) [Paramecium tetraurelia]|uniref:Uncharacterized protein n=1 Tax=Paramecium tetraurelia TaxID=5888 RepID=A0BKR4_PARTE|nr:uncharacterized protein GSPATT00029762001 [Paramecium tetraurelia]CAK59131.1 unnamed protein product [Paramecium tetraurelia]|eukprot:XP_001426529.1 hypothetical protein (macronuclear) [Paramecium tetraurelia strain d4-2]